MKIRIPIIGQDHAHGVTKPFVGTLRVSSSRGIFRRNMKVPVTTTAKGCTGVPVIGQSKTPGAVQSMLGTKIFIVIGGTHRRFPVVILNPGHTVALTTHVACKVAIISVKTRITRYVMPHPYH
jgi:hypothetical protein